MKNKVYLLIGCLLLALSACTSVKPWERGVLAKKEMAWQLDPMESKLQSHIYFAKEGSSGGGQAAGGGCGCN
ncbi:MAG: DUF4266 domain-containing protein [Pseudomonadales bacterium]|nr:DUF4266 domain-containing protein [Pseudomonadales bacterium]